MSWRVFLRVKKGKWYWECRDSEGRYLLTSRRGFDTAGRALDGVIREIEDFHAAYRCRFAA